MSASEKDDVPRPNAPSIEVTSSITIQPPLSRRSNGPGLLILVDSQLDLSKKLEKTLDPPPLQKWAEEGYAVAQIRPKPADAPDLTAELNRAIAELESLTTCETTEKMGVLIFADRIHSALMATIHAIPNLVAIVCYGNFDSAHVSAGDVLCHIPGPKPVTSEKSVTGQVKQHYYASGPYFSIPSHNDFHASSAAVAHTRTLSFLKPLVGGPYFDLEAIWDEHTYWEFEARDVAQTMATMVEEPYVNHIPTLTGGVGRAKLTEFYTHHFVFANPPDTTLELISRTVGIDRVVDEFLFKFTHDRIIGWLLPGVPPTGRYVEVPFTCVINIRGDRLYHEHISWDQGTLLRQLGLLPEYLPFPSVGNGTQAEKVEYRVPVAGVESAQKLRDESAAESNAMINFLPRNG